MEIAEVNHYTKNRCSKYNRKTVKTSQLGNYSETLFNIII